MFPSCCIKEIKGGVGEDKNREGEAQRQRRDDKRKKTEVREDKEMISRRERRGRGVNSMRTGERGRKEKERTELRGQMRQGKEEED